MATLPGWMLSICIWTHFGKRKESLCHIYKLYIVHTCPLVKMMLTAYNCFSTYLSLTCKSLKAYILRQFSLRSWRSLNPVPANCCQNKPPQLFKKATYKKKRVGSKQTKSNRCVLYVSWKTHYWVLKSNSRCKSKANNLNQHWYPLGNE